MCEVGGCESSKILKITTNKKDAEKWKRKYGRIARKLEGMRQKWRDHEFARDRDYSNVWNYSAKYGLNFDTSYAIIEEHELE